MSKWLKKFLGNVPETQPDKPDRFAMNTNMSVLSGSSGELFYKNLENMLEVRPDKPDRFTVNANMSVLSGSSGGLFYKNLENMLEVRPDKPDRFNPNVNMSVLSGPSQGDFDKPSLLNDFEERTAIAECDGQQSPLQAQRIAYQDAFIAVLNTLPHEEEEGYYDEDWLARRIKAAQNWLTAQGLQQPK